MILGRKAILEAIKRGAIGITDFDENNLKDASYTLTLSSYLRLENGDEVEISLDGYKLEPNQFVLGKTAESLALKNNHACFLSARGSVAQKGLSIFLGSHFAEPDTCDSQILEIHNVTRGEIVLKPGMQIVKAIFMPVE